MDRSQAEGQLLHRMKRLSGCAWKGNRFNPDLDVKLYAIGYIGTVVAGATYQAGVMTFNGTTVDSITKSTSVTLPSAIGTTVTKCLWLYFAEPIILHAGITYGLLVGRTDNADNYVLQIPFNGGTSNANSVPMVGKFGLVSVLLAFRFLTFDTPDRHYLASACLAPQLSY